MEERFIIWFDELQLRDIPQVGGKNASLGEMRRELRPQGVNIPNGFAVTAYAYRYLLSSAGIKDDIARLLQDLDTHDMDNLRTRGRKIRDLIYQAPIPKDLEQSILEAYANSVRSMAQIQTSLYAARPQPRISLMPVLPVSKIHILTCGATRRYWMLANVASRPSLRIAPFPTV